MDSWNKHIILAVFLLSFGEVIEANGVCQFARMFPPQRNKTCFNDKILEQIRKYCFNDEMLKEEKGKSSSPKPEPTGSQPGRSDTAITTAVAQGSQVTTQDSTKTLCPLNMVFGNCTCGATCEDPTGQHGCFNNCTEAETCICPEGFLMKEGHCVPRHECDCFLSEAGKVLANNEFYMVTDCSRRCVCRQNKLIWENDYQCSVNAVCEERNNLLRCYCKEEFVGNGQNCTLPTDCYDIFNAGLNESGIYTIKPTTWPDQPFKVYCNMDNGGGWTVFQRRVNGSVDFYLYWNDYKQGFGFLSHEFWLGNDKIFSLTNQADYTLRIDLVNYLESPFHATYDLFRIADEDHKYRLTELGPFGGTVEFEGMESFRAFDFTSRDRDNDEYIPYNCAHIWRGAWWYSKCYNPNLNGDYWNNPMKRMSWQQSHEDQYMINYSEMKIRPVVNSTSKKTN